ncbi:MAG TPA: lysine--tRNA ligase [Dehalococcoidia bacterium]|nr:lysine--tRNA ligase [Dehalococcoidia bacterium]
MSEEEIIEQRKAKLERLRSAGIEPYPSRSQRTHSSHEAIIIFEEAEARGDAALAALPPLEVAGRITAMRDMGRATFIDIRDGEGRIQTYYRKNVIGPEAYQRLQELDLGDFISVKGKLFRTKTAEITVEAESFTLLTKALRPPPEKWHGLQDVETRYRQRYLDLLANAEVRDAFLRRSRIISAIRRFMENRGFIEVETPVLQSTAGGAAARPFVTYHNALHRQLYLRVALELHLKRLIIGGYDRVFEIGRVFRNEGVSTKYNPEFTMLESYQAYADYNDVMAMVEELVSSVAQEVLGTRQVAYGDTVLDFTPPWPRISLQEAIKDYTGVDFTAYREAAELARAAAAAGVAVEQHWSRAKLVDELLSQKVEPDLLQPTFVIDYPVELSPLAKCKPEDPRFVERFELFIAGREVANAYSELNDPVEQRARFAAQAAQRGAGDEETEVVDEDFLVALEHGMPPCGGLGIGIDRLVMALTGQTSIREVILFPALRQREEQ